MGSEGEGGDNFHRRARALLEARALRARGLAVLHRRGAPRRHRRVAALLQLADARVRGVDGLVAFGPRTLTLTVRLSQYELV